MLRALAKAVSMKALQIAWKDTLTRFKDWKALTSMLAAPLIISALIGLAFSGLNKQESPVQYIPVAIVNEDNGRLGQVYEDVLGGPDLATLISLQQVDSVQAGKADIEQDRLRVVIHIPTGFSDALLPSSSTGAFALGSGSIEVFTDPTDNIGPLIVTNIVDRITAGLNTVLLAGQVSAEQAAQYAAQLGPQMANLGQALSEELTPDNYNFQEPRLTLEEVQTGTVQDAIDPFAFFIPGMAVFFLLFSMFDGSRSILLEEGRGTLPRLMSTPTPTSQIILGKMGGTFMTGILQFTILMLVSTFLFQVNWGHSLSGLATIVLLTVFAASGLGAVVTLFARNENQASVIGGAISLIFGALGGSFFPAHSLTGIVNIASKLTLNRWAMDGFTELAKPGTGFVDILPQAGVLALIGLVTFSIGLAGFQRRFVK